MTGKGDGKIGENLREQNAMIYYILHDRTEQQANVIVDAVTDNNGLEAWRRLHGRYHKTDSHKALLALMNIVNTKFDKEDQLEAQFSYWEGEITKIRRSNKEASVR